MKEYNTKSNTINNYNGYSVRNEEIVKSLAELENGNMKNSTNIPSDLKIKVSTAHLRMQAETAAELYLGVNDTAQVLSFLDFYVSLKESMSMTSSSFNDKNIVKSFNLFNGNVEKSGKFLEIAEELEELGFDDEKVVSALMLFSNDREAALDFLMKN